MDTRLHALAGQQDGAFSVHEALRLGVEASELRRAVREGKLIRLRRGAYVLGSRWLSADFDERFRLKAMAVARTREPDALSHHAAQALHGLPLWDHDPERIDMVGDVRQGVNRGGVWLHPRVDAQVMDIGGVPVVPIARDVVRTALTMGTASAVVAGDAALHAERVTVDELLREVALLSAHEGRGRALEAVHRMDSAAESVGESRTRMILQELGLSHKSQVVLRDSSGAFVARVDFLVEGVVLEFDGRVKYQRNRDGEDRDAAARDAADIVWLEKRREDRIRRLGYPVERRLGGAGAPGRPGRTPPIEAAQHTGLSTTHRFRNRVSCR